MRESDGGETRVLDLMDGDRSFVRRAFIVVAIVTLAVILWSLIDVLLLVFAAVLLAVLLQAAARPIERWLRLNGGWALTITTVALVGTVSLAIVLFGNEVRNQTLKILETAPGGWQRFLERILSGDLLEQILERAEDGGPSVAEMMSGIVMGASSFISATIAIVLILAGGLYLAAQPEVYRRGFLLLLPDDGTREQGRVTLEAIGEALKLWLVGQLATMGFIFVVTLAGLWLIDLPGALALAVFAGLAQFVPIVGPIAAAVPALLVALAEGWAMVLWVLGLYLVIQQVESNLVTPLVQRSTVSLPPALPLFAVVVFGVLFGFMGIILATPLAVMTFVLVKKLWVRDALGETTRLPGERAAAPEAPAASPR